MGADVKPLARHFRGAAGRAAVVSFTGAIFRQRVCVVYANLALDGITTRIGNTAAPDALVTTALTAGKGATLALQGDVPSLTPSAAANDPANGSFGIGPFLIAPGGALQTFGSDMTEEPRVVLGFSGARLVVMRTTAVTLTELARALRDQPDLFGADAFERAAVMASGTQAMLSVRAGSSRLGGDVATTQTLSFINRH